MTKVFAPTNRTGRIGMVGVLILLGMALASCTGRGGGVLAPDSALGFNGKATIGFSFSCENGRLRVSLEYQDHATNPFGGPFSVHGTADRISPALESAICIGEGENGALPPGVIVFEGTYTPQSGSPGAFDPDTCAVPFPIIGGEQLTGCRFTARVEDSGQRGPSTGDKLSIQLFGGANTSKSPIYARAGYLKSGNFQVDNP